MTDFRTLQLCKTPGVEMNSAQVQKKTLKRVSWGFFCLCNLMLWKTTTALASFKQQAVANLLTILQVIFKNISTFHTVVNKGGWRDYIFKNFCSSTVLSEGLKETAAMQSSYCPRHLNRKVVFVITASVEPVKSFVYNHASCLGKVSLIQKHNRKRTVK